MLTVITINVVIYIQPTTLRTVGGSLSRTATGPAAPRPQGDTRLDGTILCCTVVYKTRLD